MPTFETVLIPAEVFSQYPPPTPVAVIVRDFGAVARVVNAIPVPAMISTVSSATATKESCPATFQVLKLLPIWTKASLPPKSVTLNPVFLSNLIAVTLLIASVLLIPERPSLVLTVTEFPAGPTIP